MKRHHNEARCFERKRLLRDQTEKVAYCTLQGCGKKYQINLNDKSIKRLIDTMSNSKSSNKKINWKKIACVVFNLKRAHVAIKHISCVKNFSRKHNPTILTSSRKEMGINILDGNKESETNSR